MTLSREHIIQPFVKILLVAGMLLSFACNEESTKDPLSNENNDDDTETTEETDEDTENSNTEDSEEDTGEDTFEELDTTDYEQNDFSPFCENYCDNLHNCEFEFTGDGEYTDRISWYTTEADCPSDCTTDLEAEDDRVISDCEKATIAKNVCSMRLSCEDFAEYTAANDIYDGLPCGEEMMAEIEACY